jgi:predicted GTPase
MAFSFLQNLENLLRKKINTLEGFCKKLNKNDIVENLKKILYRLENPFLITVFGEVKSGKSSLLNALLGIPNLCKVNIDICTDRITVIKYSETPYEKPISDYVTEVGIKNELLKGFIVVDTPGINSVIEHHTEITEKFLPQSDVLLVVIPAYNPHTKNIWDWIKLIARDFGKKIVIVLQQKDRLSPEELKVNLRKTKEYAQMAGLDNPVIFAVSAKEYFEGKPSSGIEELKRYLWEHFTGEKQKLQKLKTIRFELIKLYEECIEYIESLENQLKEHKEKLQNSLDKLKVNLQTVYSYKDLIIQSLENYLSKLEGNILKEIENVPLRDFIFRKKELRRKFENIAKEIAEDIQYYIQNELSTKFKYFETGILKPSMEEAVKNVEDLREFLKKFFAKEIKLPKIEAYKITKTLTKDIETPKTQEALTFAVSGILAGSLISLLTSLPLLDITGGFIAALSAIGGGLYIITRKGKLKEEVKGIFEKTIEEKLEKEINNALETYIKSTIVSLIEVVQEHIKVINQQLQTLERKKTILEREFGELKKISFES